MDAHMNCRCSLDTSFIGTKISHYSWKQIAEMSLDETREFVKRFGFLGIGAVKTARAMYGTRHLRCDELFSNDGYCSECPVFDTVEVCNPRKPGVVKLFDAMRKRIPE